VARLLATLQVDGLAHDRLLDRFRERLYDHPGTALGVQDFLPEWHAAKLLKVRG
jgi:hypothetical protein